MMVRAEGSNRFDPPPRCEQPSHRQRNLSKGRGMVKMTPTNPSLLYQLEGESAGGASTFHIWNGDWTGRKGKRLPFSWANLESHWLRNFSLSVLLERFKLDQSRDFPEAQRAGQGLSQSLQRNPLLETSMHQPCSRALLSLGLTKRPTLLAIWCPPWMGGKGGGTPRQKSQKSGQQSETVRLQKRSQ